MAYKPTRKVDIIVLNWNGLSHLDTCLRALSAQTYQNFEVTVVDNGSEDNSIKWLQAQEITRTKIIQSISNLGFAGGNAIGLASTEKRSPFIVLLNNDTAPEPNWLAALVASAQGNDRIGAVASLIVDWAGTHIDSAGDGIRLTGRGYQRFRGRRREDTPNSGPVFSACAGAVLYRRAMLDEIGFLDERFFMNAEDTDLCFRARLAGWEVWYCADAVVRHRVSASQGVDSANNVYFNERNHIWSVVKCMPNYLLWKYSWAHMLEQPVRAIRFARRGRFIPWARGLIDGLRGIPVMLKDRRRIQRLRRVAHSDIERYFTMPRPLNNQGD